MEQFGQGLMKWLFPDVQQQQIPQQAPVAARGGYEQSAPPPSQFDFGQIQQFGGKLLSKLDSILPKYQSRGSEVQADQGMKLTTTVNPDVIDSANEQIANVANIDVPPRQNFGKNIKPQPMDPNYRFAYEKLNRDSDYAFKSGPRPGFNPNQPPSDIGNIIREIFPNEATTAASVAASEDGRFSPTAQSPVNNDGSIDRGIFAINSHTFNGLMERQGDLLKKYGISSYEDMYDPYKNAIAAKLIHEGSKIANPKTQGWGPWFGWQDTGYDVNNDYYSQPQRADYELKQRGR